MEILSSSKQLRQLIKQQKLSGKTIALVPTMGNLHSGHIKLVEQARQAADFVVTTIFVNPMQFGAGEDLDAYPRSLAADTQKLIAAQCHCLFTPTVEDIYPTGIAQQSVISVPKISENFCGNSRPGHFDGVATVVNKFFNIVQPDQAYFGLKDYQQLLLIKKMAADLAMDIDIIGVATQREASGLALSSRNGYLSDSQKQQAALLYQCLQTARDAILSGNKDFLSLQRQATQLLESMGARVDFFSICNAGSLQPATAEDTALVILAAAFIGPTRLIDNIQIQLS